MNILSIAVHLTHLFHYRHKVNLNVPIPPGLRRKFPPIKQLALSTVLALSAIPSAASTNSCLLPQAFNPYFQAALDDVQSTLESRVVQGLDDIGFGSVSALAVNDLLNIKEDVFIPLFGDAAQRNTWINVMADLNVMDQITSNLNNLEGVAGIPSLSLTCGLETTEDLEEGDLPYRFGMEFEVTGMLFGEDFDLEALSPSIAVLPEELFDPLSLTVNGISIGYTMSLSLTIDIKRRKFMMGEMAITLGAALSTSIMQSFSLTDTVSQSFAGNLDLVASMSYSSLNDWVYTASFETSLTAETSVGTAVENLGLIAIDDDLFDDKPRECKQSCVPCRYFCVKFSDVCVRILFTTSSQCIL